MDLMFEKSSLSYLKCIVQNTAYQEETGETVVPDSYPDIYSIICTYADVVIRGKEVRNGGVIVSGAVRGSIIYEPEDHTFPRNLDIYFPFSVKIEHSAIAENVKIISTAKVCSTDSRVINSRKALIRVNIGYYIAVYGTCVEELYEITDAPETLQLRREDYTFFIPYEVSEKSVSLSEKLDIPNSNPPISKIYKLSVSMNEIDKKLVSNKGLFKCNLYCKVLYLSDDEKLYTYSQLIPFSQFCEFENDYDNDRLDIHYALTGVDYSHIDGSNSIQLGLDLLAEGVVSKERTFNLISDAYSTAHVLEAEWKSYCIDGELDRIKENERIRHVLNGEFSEIIDADAFVSYPDIRCNGDKVQIVTPVILQVLGVGGQRTFFTAQDKIDVVQEFHLDAQAQCVSFAMPNGEIQNSLLSDSVEIQFNLDFQHRFCSKQTIKTLCGGRTSDREVHGKDPSIIIRKVKKNTDLWEVAKGCRSRKEHICVLNDIHGDILPEDQYLLIPVG